jgi:hypothetical protein
MAQHIKSPSIIKAAGVGEKIIREYFGHVNSKTSEVSIAHMKSPAGWSEPGQKPQFNEYTVVLKGKLLIKTKKDEYIVEEGQGRMGSVQHPFRRRGRIYCSLPSRFFTGYGSQRYR